MERIKKLDNLAKEYGFETRIEEKENVVVIIIRAKGTDGKWVDWFSFTKFGSNSSFIKIVGNTVELNIWLYRTRLDLSANDIYDFFDKFNDIIGHCEKAPVRKFVDPEDWKEIADIEDAYKDARYTGAGRQVALTEDNINCVDELIVNTDDNTIGATYETWFDTEKYFGCDEMAEEEWLSFYTWYHLDTGKLTAKYIIDTPDGEYEHDWNLTSNEEELLKDCMEAYSIIREGKGLAELFKEMKEEEMCVWVIGISSSECEGVYLGVFHGTRTEVKQKLYDMVMEDREADKENFDYGTGSIDDVDMVGEDWFNAINCYTNYTIHYTAKDIAKVEMIKKKGSACNE